MITINSKDILKGTVMLLIYSIGFGIPFAICALLIDTIKETFNIIEDYSGDITKEELENQIKSLL